MKTFLVVAVTLFCLSVLAGCNTVRGVGQDVKSAGHAIERASGK